VIGVAMEFLLEIHIGLQSDHTSTNSVDPKRSLMLVFSLGGWSGNFFSEGFNPEGTIVGWCVPCRLAFRDGIVSMGRHNRYRISCSKTNSLATF
jgi:hypothetical protein